MTRPIVSVARWSEYADLKGEPLLVRVEDGFSIRLPGRRNALVLFGTRARHLRAVRAAMARPAPDPDLIARLRPLYED